MATTMLPDLVLVEVFKRTLQGSSRADRAWQLFQLSHVCRDWERIVATNGSLFESTQIRLYKPLARLDVSDSEDGFIPDASEHAQRILRINRRSHLLLKWQMSDLIRQDCAFHNCNAKRSNAQNQSLSQPHPVARQIATR